MVVKTWRDEAPYLKKDNRRGKENATDKGEF